jgi:hypothetical protein
VGRSSEVGERPRLRLLLDSNIIVAVEPYAGAIEPNMRAAAELLRRASELGHILCVAPATRHDLLGTSTRSDVRNGWLSSKSSPARRSATH